MQPYNKHTIKKHFESASSTYDEAAVLQKSVADDITERLRYISLKPDRVLDLGSGTGLLTNQLTQLYPKANIYATDIAFQMLKTAKNKQSVTGVQRIQRWFNGSNTHHVNADAYQLPYANGAMDMVVSNLMLQWVDDLDAVFKEIRRVLRPEGVLLFSTLGPDTLKELRQAWQSVDDQPHINTFIDMHDLGDALIRAGFGQPVMDVAPLVLTYPKPIQVLKDLKAIGATNAHQTQRKGLMGKQKFTKMLTAYETQKGSGDRVNATYEVVHGHAWAAPEIIKGPNRDKSGVYEITLDAFTKTTSQKN